MVSRLWLFLFLCCFFKQTTRHVLGLTVQPKVHFFQDPHPTYYSFMHILQAKLEDLNMTLTRCTYPWVRDYNYIYVDDSCEASKEFAMLGAFSFLLVTMNILLILVTGYTVNTVGLVILVFICGLTYINFLVSLRQPLCIFHPRNEQSVLVAKSDLSVTFRCSKLIRCSHSTGFGSFAHVTGQQMC